MPDGNAEKGRKAETPAKTDKPPKADGARKRSANQAPPEGNAGGKCRAEIRAEIRAETQTGNNGRKYPAGTTKTKKTFFNELL